MKQLILILVLMALPIGPKAGDLITYDSTLESHIVNVDSVQRITDGHQSNMLYNVHGRPVAVIAYDTVVTETWEIKWGSDKHFETPEVIKVFDVIPPHYKHRLTITSEPIVRHTADTTITKKVRWLE
jgi:hypothetical protein